MNRRAVFPIGFLALSVLAIAAQGMILKRTPKVGDKANYVLNGTFEAAGAEAKVSGSVSEEVTKVEDDKYTTVATTKMTLNVMGQEMAQPDSTETATMKLDGTLVEAKSGAESVTPSALRLAHLNTIYLPGKEVKLDETWTLEGKKDEKLDIPGYKVEYKLIGEEKVENWDTYKVTANGTETEGSTPTKIKATYWIEKSTGNHIKSIAELTDAVFQPEIPPISGKMEVSRKGQ